MWRQINNSFSTFPKLPPSAQIGGARENNSDKTEFSFREKFLLPLSLNLGSVSLKGFS